MVVGHFATALAAQRMVPTGHIAFYLVISQLPDLLWHAFHFLGLEPTGPDNPMAASLDNMHAQMTYSHDLLPTLGWVAVAILAGRALFGGWRPGWMAGALIVVHALCDAVSGHPHFVFGPDSPQIGLGLYGSAPYIALAIEAVFTLAVMAWVARADATVGVRRGRSTRLVWAAVFGGGILMLLPTADLSILELTGVAPIEALSGMLVPGLVALYVTMLLALVWADTRPTTPIEGAPAA